MSKCLVSLCRGDGKPQIVMLNLEGSNAIFKGCHVLQVLKAWTNSPKYRVLVMAAKRKATEDDGVQDTHISTHDGSM